MNKIESVDIKFEISEPLGLKLVKIFVYQLSREIELRKYAEHILGSFLTRDAD